MALTERQNDILKLLKEQKKAEVNELASALYVSEATIRRDLTQMQNMGLIERSHGGAILPENAEEISMFFRMERNANEKERAATKAIPYLPYFQSVFLDSSSTVLALAERIELKHKTVLTNSLHTALQLSKIPNVNLILLGGSVQFNTNSAIGSWTARQLKDFSLDLMISSCKAIVGSAAFESSLDQKEIKRTAFEQCRKHVLIIDHTKFSAHASYKLNELSEYDFVATDAPPPEELLKQDIRFIY